MVEDPVPDEPAIEDPVVNDSPHGVDADEPTSADVAAARRTRFRRALTALGTASSRDLTRWVLLPAAILVVAGFNLMIFGWWGAARTAREIEQIPYLISGGLIGLGLVIVGSLLLATALWASITGRMTREAEERHRRELAALEDRLRTQRAARPNRSRRPRKPSGQKTP